MNLIAVEAMYTFTALFVASHLQSASLLAAVDRERPASSELPGFAGCAGFTGRFQVLAGGVVPS